MSTDPSPTVNLDAVVARYIQLRDIKAAKKKAYEADVEQVDKAMEKIENALLKHLNASQSESVRTESGTFYKQRKTSVTTADREAFLRFCREQDQWPLLEVRPSKTAVEQYRDDNKDLPPGVNWSETTVVNVRR